MIIALAVPALVGQKIETRDGDAQAILRIETARDHLSVIELERPPVTGCGRQPERLLGRAARQQDLSSRRRGQRKTSLFIWQRTAATPTNSAGRRSGGNAFRHRPKADAIEDQCESIAGPEDVRARGAHKRTTAAGDADPATSYPYRW